MGACYASKNLPSTRNETRKSNNFPLCRKVSRERVFIYDFRILTSLHRRMAASPYPAYKSKC
ncbi:hypothetical protein XS74_22270 [Salmonella enterica subsp. enterica]|uniref:Uncharacterized protein n=1 Tax=Salmonella enterica subsp. salamae TaxID=59202 RepID=A0A3Y3TMN9_SALER|nr:hypothetical protein [Salmonella enterica subsp. enterica]EAB6843696.1 hypothetical protein [Salmonella enterica subsp. salamae]EAO2687461.1 hypothetical protein [Salmonella enterica]EBW4678537.1 hypothetical protein [Salmonella enterica subsp. salamae serovar Sofia]HAC6700069.1 hypothetical protein [Salmonella bongori serovar 66:z65:-]